MKKRSRIYTIKSGYSFLFLSLIFFFILSPIVSIFPFFSLLFKALFLLTTILAIETFNLSSFYVLICRILALLAFLADVIIFPSATLTSLTTIISHWCYLLFFCLTIISISIKISRESKINTYVILGSICIYLLIGIIWFIIYTTIEFFDPQAFSIPAEINNPNLLLYFSFTTLTTVGYGDITPINSFAMVLANTEAIIGQLYPAIVIAKLVSLHTSA